MKYEVPDSLISFINKQLTRAQYSLLKRLVEGVKYGRAGSLTRGVHNNFQNKEGVSVPSNVVQKLELLGLVILEETGRESVVAEPTALGVEVYIKGSVE